MIVAIIPARYASSRLPGKPLEMIGQKPMVQWVYEHATQAKKVDRVVVATDDDRIMQCVEGFGGQVVMTSDKHPSGTDRCQEAFSKLAGSYTHVLNIQGDEPFIDPSVIDQLAELMLTPDAQIATLATKITDATALADPNVVKVVIGLQKQALYFSRYPIPYQREKPVAKLKIDTVHLRHYGLYAYRADILATLAALPPSGLEISESLEQLRWLENGFRIAVGITETNSLAIDTPEDLAKAKQLISNLPSV